jgi:hypothetical protein
MSTCPDVDAFFVPTDQERSDREPLEVVELERYLVIRRRQLRPRRSPGLPSEGLTSPLDRTDHGLSLVPSRSIRRRRRLDRFLEAAGHLAEQSRPVGVCKLATIRVQAT